MFARNGIQHICNDLNAWWPKDKHSVSAMGGEIAREVKFDAKQGGEIIEVMHDGTETLWGSAREFSPHSKLSLAWHIGKSADEASFVDVTFEAAGDMTKVTLTHHGWEVFGDSAAAMREGYNNGWVHVFEACFAKACD
ncbi:MAG: SRPBCC domain-containing protein [Paracoccaceae bacterium]|nr:SRPBCC domain-containing protein [Paracoccaceae bacterium]